MRASIILRYRRDEWLPTLRHMTIVPAATPITVVDNKPAYGMAQPRLNRVNRGYHGVMQLQYGQPEGLAGSLRQIRQHYAHGNPRPLGGYLVALGSYGAYAGGMALLLRRHQRKIPERPAVADIVLTGVATHKLSRMMAKDPITSPLRAPVTRFEEPSGQAEIHESVRGHGVAHAAGELVRCPFCLASWVATGLTAGLVVLPRTTRLACAVFTATTISDTLQLAYSWLKSSAG